MTLSRRFFLASVISLEMGCCAPVRMTGLSAFWMRAGEDDGFVGVLDEVGQRRRRVGQRVGAVADDEAVVEGIIFLHGLCHHQPVLRAEVGAVDAAQGQRVGAAELVQLRQMSQKLFAGEHGLEALLGADAGDGAAGGDKKQTLLCGHRKSLHQED